MQIATIAIIAVLSTAIYPAKHSSMQHSHNCVIWLSEGRMTFNHYCKDWTPYPVKPLPLDCEGYIEVIKYYKSKPLTSYLYFKTYQCMTSSASREAFYEAKTLYHKKEINVNQYFRLENIKVVPKHPKDRCAAYDLKGSFFSDSYQIILPISPQPSPIDILTAQVDKEAMFCKYKIHPK